MNQQYLEKFERSDRHVRVDDREIGVAYLKPRYEGEMLDIIFERGEDSALAALSPEEQIALCRFLTGSFLRATPTKEM